MIAMNDLEAIREKKRQESLKKLKTGDKKMESKIEVTDMTFDQDVLKRSNDVPVVVDFWAPWCGPCRMIGPVLEKLASDYDGKFILAKLNVDENQRVASKFGIRSIPSVKMFKDGKVIDEFVGAIPAQAIVGWLEQHV